MAKAPLDVLKSFHFFISANTVTDTHIAESITNGLQYRNLPDERNVLCSVRSDHTLQPDSLSALQESCVFVPIFTEASLNVLATLNEDSVNRFLVTLLSAVELSQSSGLVIMPLLVGKTDKIKASASEEVVYKKFDASSISLPDRVIKSKEISSKVDIPATWTVKSIVHSILKHPGILVNPENLDCKVEVLVNRFSQEIWPFVRKLWKHKEILGMEPTLTCVQCDKEFTWSQNKPSACKFHKGFVRGSDYLCCGLSAYDGSQISRGCASGSHRSKHHQDYTYEAYFFWVIELINKNENNEEYLNLRVCNYETGESAVIRVGRILPHHSQYANSLYVFMDPTDEFLPHRVWFNVISSAELSGTDCDSLVGVVSVANKAMNKSSESIKAGYIEIDGKSYAVEKPVDGFIDNIPRLLGQLGQHCEVSWFGENGRVTGIKATCKTASSAQAENRILHFNWPGLNSKARPNDKPFPKSVSITNLSTASFGELRPSRPYNIPHPGQFESGPRLLLPEPRDPDKFESQWRPAVPTKNDPVFRMKVQSISIMRNRFSFTEDQVGVSLHVINLSDKPVSLIDKDVYWRFRFPPNCLKEMYHTDDNRLKEAEQDSVIWKAVAKGDVEAYLAESNAASVPLGIINSKTDNAHTKSFPITIPPNESIMVHLRFCIKYPQYLSIRQSWSTETRFRSHLVRRGPVLFEVEFEDFAGNKSTLTAEVSWTADPADILPGMGKNKRGDERQVLHRCDDVYANDRIFLRIIPFKETVSSNDRVVFRIEGPSDSSISPRNVTEVDLRRAVLRADKTNNTEIDLLVEHKPGIYSIKASMLIDRNCRRVFAVKTFIEMLAPLDYNETPPLPRAKSVSFWLVPLYGDSVLDGGVQKTSVPEMEPADDILSIPALHIPPDYHSQPPATALFQTSRQYFEPRLPPVTFFTPLRNRNRLSVAETVQSQLSEEVVVTEEIIDRRSWNNGGVGVIGCTMQELEQMVRRIVKEEIAASIAINRDSIRTQMIEPPLNMATERMELRMEQLVNKVLASRNAEIETYKQFFAKERDELANSVVGNLENRWGHILNQFSPNSYTANGFTTSTSSLQQSSTTHGFPSRTHHLPSGSNGSNQIFPQLYPLQTPVNSQSLFPTFGPSSSLSAPNSPTHLLSPDSAFGKSRHVSASTNSSQNGMSSSPTPPSPPLSTVNPHSLRSKNQSLQISTTSRGTSPHTGGHPMTSIASAPLLSFSSFNASMANSSSPPSGYPYLGGLQNASEPVLNSGQPRTFGHEYHSSSSPDQTSAWMLGRSNSTHVASSSPSKASPLTTSFIQPRQDESFVTKKSFDEQRPLVSSEQKSASTQNSPQLSDSTHMQRGGSSGNRFKSSVGKVFKGW